MSLRNMLRVLAVAFACLLPLVGSVGCTSNSGGASGASSAGSATDEGADSGDTTGGETGGEESNTTNS